VKALEKVRRRSFRRKLSFHVLCSWVIDTDVESCCERAGWLSFQYRPFVLSRSASGCLRVVDQFPRLWFVLDEGCRQGVAASPSSVDNDSRVCCVVSSRTRLRAVTTLGRWTNGAEDSRALLCRCQSIAAESKHRCFDGKLKFCKIV